MSSEDGMRPPLSPRHADTCIVDDLSVERRDEILSIIEREFDLEILLKYRELRVIEHEMERGRELKALLEKLLLNGKHGRAQEQFHPSLMAGCVCVATEYIYADRAAGRQSAPPVAFLTSGRDLDEDEETTAPHEEGVRRHGSAADSSIYGLRTRGADLARSATAMPMTGARPGGVSSAQQYQYEIRSDGTVVRMRCPTCGADKFRSRLGFLNHCRIYCKLTFANQEERLQRCGIPVPPDEVPPEYRSLSLGTLQQSLQIAQLCADVLPTKIVTNVRPHIKLHEDESLDLQAFGIAVEATAAIVKTNDANPSSAEQAPRVERSAQQSRYYLKRHIVVGNSSKCIISSGETEELVGGRPATHYFKLYIRDPNFRHRAAGRMEDAVLRHIKFARFFLHPAYKPHDVIDVHRHPFTLVRPAWGEFPLRIQLHFHDPRNKPVSILHPISLFSSKSPIFSNGAERMHEIDLDKQTDFSLSESASAAHSHEDGDGNDDDDVMMAVETDGETEDGDEFESLDVSSAGVSRDVVQTVDPKSLKYCRYCGVPHMPQQNFDVSQKNCMHRPRKIRLSSRTTQTDLFSRCIMHDGEVEHMAEVDVEETERLEDSGTVDMIDESADDCDKFAAAIAVQLGLSALRPTCGVSAVLSAAVKCFLRDLTKQAIKHVPTEAARGALDQKLPAILTPMHVFKTVTQDDLSSNNSFDFLSNAYFSATHNPG